jgi:hypothetical protein
MGPERIAALPMYDYPELTTEHDLEPDDHFIGVLSHERQTAALGYPALV